MVQWRLVVSCMASASFCLVLACNRSEEPPNTQPIKPDVSLAHRESVIPENQTSEKDPFREWDASAKRFGREPGERRPRALRGNKEFSQSIQLVKPIEFLKVGQTITVPVWVKNTGNKPWPKAATSPGVQPVLLWYHWLDGTWPNIRAQANNTASSEARPRKKRRPLLTSKLSQIGKVVEFGGLRTPLPQELGPGEEVTLNASIKAPAKPGEFVLRLTMFREGGDSFEERGGRPLDIPLFVTAQ